MDAKTALKSFYQEVGEKYPEEEQVYTTLRGRLRRRFVLAHLARWQGSLLDIGCNRGMYIMAYSGGTRFGVDLSLSALKHAPAGHGLHLVQGDAERLDFFKPASFQHVLCSEVLEHCLHPQALFAGMAQALKPGGIALLTTPNYRGERPQWIDLGVLQEYDVTCDCQEGYFHTAYRPEELAAMAVACGLDVLESGTLEKEVKYAAKIPAAILLAVRALNRVFRSRRLNHYNESLFNWLTLAIYHICHWTGLDRVLLWFVKEGVRSYIIMTKPLSIEIGKEHR